MRLGRKAIAARMHLASVGIAEQPAAAATSSSQEGTAQQEGMPALRLTDLSERLLVRPPSVAGVVERLERSGLVARQDSETDLRAKLVSLTPKGRQLLDQVLAVHGKQIESILGVLEPEEQVQLHDMFHRLV